MLFAPLEGWRHIKVADRHTAIEYAQVLKDLAEVHFPRAKTIVLVQDNLNIHSKASLYEAFPAAGSETAGRALIWPNPNSAFWPLNAPRPPHSRQADPHRRNHRLGARAKHP
jgi:hypothetical protein